MNKPLISVIVPIYGIERYIGICVESIIKQTYKNLEIILVDDGSPDRCPELCDLYAKKDSRIKVIHKVNGGLVSARKAGIKIATGDYATYVDGDDWIAPNYFEELMKASNNADTVIAGFSRVLFDTLTPIVNNIKPGVYEGKGLEDVYSNMLSCDEFYKLGITTYVWNKLFKRELLLKYQLMVDNAISIGEDAAVVYPLLMECKKVVITNNIDYHYRQREDSMLKKSKLFKEEIKGLKLLYNYLIDFASNQDAKHHLINQVEDYILSMCLMRSGCLEIHDELILPFEKDFRNKNIAIYSAGTFGQQLVNRINEHKYANIVSWVDVDYWEYRRCCLDVDDIPSLYEKDFDYVLLATVSGKQANKIKNELVSHGIDKNKVLSIKLNKEKSELIKKFMA